MHTGSLIPDLVPVYIFFDRYQYRQSVSGGVVQYISRRDQIGIGDDKENKKHVLGARRLADKAALDHAFMMRAYPRYRV